MHMCGKREREGKRMELINARSFLSPMNSLSCSVHLEHTCGRAPSSTVAFLARGAFWLLAGGTAAGQRERKGKRIKARAKRRLFEQAVTLQRRRV